MLSRVSDSRREEIVHTRLSKTHLLSFHSAGRHCQSCWLLSSRHIQCFLNSARQCLLTSSILYPDFQPYNQTATKLIETDTLAAHLVTLLPSFRQSSSPFPALSVLHCMKSSLNDRHRAPMKKLAERRGADEAPTSFTGGIEAGRGVVSMRFS